eukprot:2213183-Alexandrium_andersonii.AAC.1
MSVEQRAHLRSCGGVGAGSFLEGPPAEGGELPDELWETSTRYRAGLKWPAHDTFPRDSDPGLVCAHCTRKGK